jgi:hypothetical protein
MGTVVIITTEVSGLTVREQNGELKTINTILMEYRVVTSLRYLHSGR